MAALLLAASQPAWAQGGRVPATQARPTVPPLPNDSVSITWSGPYDSGITGCQVLRRNPEVHDRQVFETIDEDTGSSDTGVVAETSYFYRQTARNAHAGRAGRRGSAPDRAGPT